MQYYLFGAAMSDFYRRMRFTILFAQFFPVSTLKREKNTIEEILVYSLRFPQHALPAPLDNSSETLRIEEELVKCGRTAYVDYHKQILNEKNYLTKRYGKLLQFSTGKEMLLPKNIGWTFDPSLQSRIPIHFQYLVQSGIYNFLKACERLAKSRGRENQTSVLTSRIITKMEKATLSQLSGNIQTIFWVYISATIISCCAFATETVTKLIRNRVSYQTTAIRLTTS